MNVLWATELPSGLPQRVYPCCGLHMIANIFFAEAFRRLNCSSSACRIIAVQHGFMQALAQDVCHERREIFQNHFAHRVAIRRKRASFLCTKVPWRLGPTLSGPWDQEGGIDFPGGIRKTTPCSSTSRFGPPWHRVALQGQSTATIFSDTIFWSQFWRRPTRVI